MVIFGVQIFKETKYFWDSILTGLREIEAFGINMHLNIIAWG